MQSAWLISRSLLRAWRRHPLRAFAAVIGVTLGATLATLVVSINEAVSGASQSVSAADVVKADLAVQARSAGGISSELAQRVRSAAADSPVTAVLQVNTQLAGGDGDGPRLSVLGVDRAARRFLPPGVTARFAERELEFDAPGLVAGEDWLRSQGFRVGDRIQLEAAGGTSSWVIVGVIRGDLPNEGAIAVGPLDRVGFTFGRPGTVDTMYLQVPEQASREALVQRLQRAVRRAATIGPLDLVGASSARSLLAVQAMLLVAGFIGLLSAAAVVFVSWRLLLENERASIARFRLAGATPVQLAAGSGIVLLSTAIACCLVGLPAGVLAARLLHDLTSQLIGFTGLAAEFSAGARAASLLAGLSGALVIAGAAWIAGVRTFVAISPLEAIRPVDPPPPRTGGRWWTLGAGGAALALAAGVAFFLPLSFGAAGVLLVLVGALLLAIGMVGPLGRGLARSSTGFSSLAAGRQVAADGRRTVAIALMIALGVTAWLTLAAVASSYQHAIDRSVRSWTHADLFVRMGVPGQTLRDARFPPGVQQRLARLPGVASAGAFTFVVMDYRGRNLMFQAYDTERIDGVADLITYSGLRGESMWEAMEEGQIAVSESMARLDGLKVGDTIVLPGAEGSRRLRIASVIDDYVSEGGTVVGSLKTFTQVTGERRIDDIPLVLEHGVSPSLTAGRVRRALPGYESLTILGRQQFRDSITEFISSVSLLFQALAVVAFFIVLLAATLTLAASLSVRRRALAISRLAGASPGQLRLQLGLETGAIALAAWLLAVISTSLLVPNMLNSTAARTGLLPAIEMPVTELVLALPLGLVTAMLATSAIARMVSKEDITEILRSD